MMPAMSPLMAEGTIRRWKKKEGEHFQAGDVLLEIVRRNSSYVRVLSFLI
jgi:pyruvate/2-oxoglutarate dehydrogenase complex dihydrolipoamide acyltransferase (E2) component